jgi:hypothetical protein
MLPLVQGDDESMSGGDESDDMDLTDDSCYGSDASEWNEGTLLNSVVSTAASHNTLEVSPWISNIPSPSTTPRCPDIMAFPLASLRHGLLTPLLPFE